MRRILAFAALTTLAACNSGPTVSATNASAAEVEAKVAAAGGGPATMSPGRWEGTMTMHDMKMPKLPADQQAMIAGKMGKPTTFASCVTPEQIKENKAFFTGNNKSCKYDHFTMGGGKIDAAMTCASDGTTMKATMKGTFSADTYHMDMASTTDSSSPYSAMSVTMTIDGKRNGECRGTEDKE